MNGETKYKHTYAGNGDLYSIEDVDSDIKFCYNYCRALNVYGTVLVEYAYDAWGNVLDISGTYASTLGQNNPIRYRGYY